MSKVTFYIQFERRRGTIEATKITKTRIARPRGAAAISVKFVADIPSFVFDPFDLIAIPVDVPAENVEPVIRLESIGPVLPVHEPAP